MSSAIDNIREQLEAELEIAESEVGRLAEEHAAAQRDHKAIKDALSALGRPGQGAKKPAFKKADVLRLLSKLLSDADQPKPLAELDAAIREHARQSGMSATGLQLRLKEALADARFVQSDDGIMLKKKVPART